MIELRPMNEQEFHTYLETTIPLYAQDNIESGAWPADQALQLSREAYAELLPQGLNTENQHLFIVFEPELQQQVGMIWFAVIERLIGAVAFIYDFAIDPEHRRKGYAQQALKAIEPKVRELGITKIELHVFAHNHGALALYQKSGFNETNIIMSKIIEPNAD
jgi:ribosomal protein S18 acetylase RimI-like enzyme